MKALIIIIIMLISDIIIFGLIVPYVIKKAYRWYTIRTTRETVDVNPITALLTTVGGVK